MRTMPLCPNTRGEGIDIDENGNVVGLFSNIDMVTKDTKVQMAVDKLRGMKKHI